MKSVAAARVFLGILLVLLALGARSAAAQTWQWQVVVRAPDTPPVSGETQVVLSPSDVTMSYSVNVQQHQVPISQCRTPLANIANAKAVRAAEHSFLLLYLKPQASAACISGPQPVAMVPVTDDGMVTRVAAVINHACCTPIVAARPAESPPPAIQPSPRRSDAPQPAVVDARLVRRGSSSLAGGQAGVAVVRVALGADGLPHDASIVSISNRRLVAAALETAVSSTYSPATRQGRAVAGTYVATFQFAAAHAAAPSTPVSRRREPSTWRDPPEMSAPEPSPSAR
jgi:hypothetical protein